MIRKIGLICAVFIFAASTAILAAGSEDALGIWLNPKGDAKITVYKCGDKYCGKITWLKTPEDLDTKNPDPAKRSQKILGMDIMHGFKYMDGEWKKGKIYDPDSGDTYSCKMWLEGKDKLVIKGYILGMPFLGRAETWTRTN
jgi:uncharacterized protein (DUF2147 family)